MTKNDLLQGTLDMLILKALSRGPLHGYAVARWLEHATDDSLRVEEGSLYPALYRMEERGWIASEWGVTDRKRNAKFYRLTKIGRKQLESESSSWAHMSALISKVMQTA
jgi:transcriptional regulator